MPKLTRPSPATVIACLALFVALGGTGYAAIALPKNSVGPKQLKTGAVRSKDIRNNTIRSVDIRNNNLTTRDIRNRTLRGRDIRPDSLRGRQIVESTLATVPHATTADTLGGVTAGQLKLACPAGTVAASATCIEGSPRPAESWGQANTTCTLAGRRLPTYPELASFLTPQRPVAAGGELTANVGESGTTPGMLVATVMLTIGGSSVEFIDATGNDQRAFRCAAAPTN